MVLSPKTITLTLTNSFHILLRYHLWLPDWQRQQVVATRNSPLRSIVLIEVVLFPRSIISTLTNSTCICYLYGHGCLNTSKGVIYLCYPLLSALVSQIFFSNSVSHLAHHSGTSYNFLQVEPYRLQLNRSIIPTLMNLTCNFYLYGHGYQNVSDGIIYLHL